VVILIILFREIFKNKPYWISNTAYFFVSLYRFVHYEKESILILKFIKPLMMMNLMKKMPFLIAILLVGICCSMTTLKEESRISANEFKAHGSLVAVLNGFDFDAKCVISSFTLTRVPKHKDVVTTSNMGSIFRTETQALVNEADHGDVYYFDDIKARCPGDEAGRNIASLVFTIK
jgi:hypothetical protein